MRAWIVLLTLLASGVARGETLTAWKTPVHLGRPETTELILFGPDKPNVMLPQCRCLAGNWKLTRGGESATHFTGTLSDISANYPRTDASLKIKIRKTRYLLGAHRDYRAALLAIVRGSGALIVREVTGGEWEVVGYSPIPVGKLFGSRPQWRVDKKKLPDPAPATELVDPARDAAALAKLINDYRASIKLPRVPISKALTKVAQVHVRDLNEQKPANDKCNMHSWSSSGSWTSCCYTGGATAKCMWVKPKEIAGYAGNGYEIAASAAGISPAQALAQWQNSPPHHEVMINKGIWTKPWRAFGVAIDGDYAVAWFGEEADK